VELVWSQPAPAPGGTTRSIESAAATSQWKADSTGRLARCDDRTTAPDAGAKPTRRDDVARGLVDDSDDDLVAVVRGRRFDLVSRVAVVLDDLIDELDGEDLGDVGFDDEPSRAYSAAITRPDAAASANASPRRRSVSAPVPT
jgi:hypothetical protein